MNKQQVIDFIENCTKLDILNEIAFEASIRYEEEHRKQVLGHTPLNIEGDHEPFDNREPEM